MTEFIEIESGAARACKRMHESGHPMVVLHPFRPQSVSVPSLEALFDAARQACDLSGEIIRVCLEPNQGRERSALESIGFVVDGFEYGLALEALRAASNAAGLPSGFDVRLMHFESDIDAVVALETAVHRADPTSRVKFDTPDAVAGMRDYYRRASSANGVYLLLCGNTIIGLAGFMPDRERQQAIHISSVSIDLAYQGQGLFFPMLASCLKSPAFEKYRLCTGVTTTARLVEAANRHSALLLGVSLCRRKTSNQ